ncbi:DUF6086 family protein [Streptomyces glaucosporus]|uniref:DUF6086 family protein n=1 Tax=Streptomyces glaucosporus TaxID=284044 RepID=UPI0031D86D61
MSCFFLIGDIDVWNPANTVARVFHAEASALAEVFGTPSGLGPVVDDECSIDGRDFAHFVEVLLSEHRRTSHPVLKALLEGVIGVGLVLLERAGGEGGAIARNAGEFWEDRRRSLSRRMTRG